FELPPGGVLIKEFAKGTTRLETRFLARDFQGEWKAATYVWNQAQTDAVLETQGTRVSPEGEDDDEDEHDEEDVSWTVPSEEQCFECHTQVAGMSLGLEQQQLALFMEY